MTVLHNIPHFGHLVLSSTNTHFSSFFFHLTASSLRVAIASGAEGRKSYVDNMKDSKKML